MNQTLPDLRNLLGTNSLFTQFYPFSSNGQFPNEIIWFQSRNNKFAVFLSLGKISASILQQMENGQIQQQKYFFQKKILNLRMFFEDIPKKVDWLNFY